jgi:hypothetical protein
MPAYVPGHVPDLTFDCTTWTPEGSVITTGRATDGYTVGSFGTPPTTVEAQTLQTAANSNIAAGSSAGEGDSAIGFTWDAQGGGPPWTITLTARASRNPYGITPFNIDPDDLPFSVVQPNGGIYWHPEYLPSELVPDNQIGFEWLDEPGVPGNLRVITPTDVTLTLSIQGLNYDESVDSPVSWTNHFIAQTDDVEFVSDTDTTPAGPDLVVAWTGLGGDEFYETNSAEVGSTIEVSLFDYLDDMHRCLIWSRALAPGQTPLAPGDITEYASPIGYGNTFTASVQTWHYQPPPYRWILDATPRLRHYPADGTEGGGGWGGVVRGYPPSRHRRGYGGARQP